MRILLVHNFYQIPGGGELAVFEAEKKLLESRGHDVRVYTRHNDELQACSTASMAARTIWNPQTVRDVGRLLAREPHDLVHAHNTFSLVSPSLYYAAARAGVPVVQTLHNFRTICASSFLQRSGHPCDICPRWRFPAAAVWYACYRGRRAPSAVLAAMQFLHRATGTWNRKVAAYIALTQFARQEFIKAGFPAGRIFVKPNFLEPDPGEGGHGSGRALFVGMLSREKGADRLREAWTRAARAPGARLAVAGWGPMAEEILAWSRSDPTVEFLGRVDHPCVLELMKESAFLLFPTQWYEGFPMVLAEAFATGLPVLASDLGSAGEIVEEGVTGRLVPPADTEVWAERIGWMMSHAAEVREMGRRARRVYESRYTADRNYEQLMQIYERAVRRALADLPASAALPPAAEPPA